jgi:GNAT superfamily N-acetyltransferase
VLAEGGPSHIEYSSPKEAIEQGEEPQHRFDLILDGERIGAAGVNYYSTPIPLYQLTDLYVDYEHSGKGNASRLLDQVEEFLRERRKPGVLVDAIIEDKPTSGMYARRGWQEVPGGYGLHVYNWPNDVDLRVLKGYASRQTDITERDSFRNNDEIPKQST